MTKVALQTRVRTAARKIVQAAWWGICALPNLAIRLYALALGVVVVTLTFLALKYLIVGILVEHPPPSQVTDLPLHTTIEDVVREPGTWAALGAVENPRTPPAHYHRITSLLPFDAKNDCTRSGCHGPLPHSARREVRAFLNMHASALHCGACHVAIDSPQLPLVWYDPQTGAATAPPPLLAAYDWLTRHESTMTFDEASQREIVTLLRGAAGQPGAAPRLQQLADHLQAVRASDETFKRLVQRATVAVDQAFRGGAYGAKLAIADENGKPTLGHPGTQAQVRDYLARGSTLDAKTRELLIESIHPLRRAQPLRCSDCHKSAGAVQFDKFGYPAGRQDKLIDAPITRMIESIERGQEFHLPQLTREPND
ncbi:MAG: hypothetical protein AB7N71_09845 [Phycisphaerae bacterium]